MKNLVLIGAEQVHLHLLMQLAQRALKAPLPFQITLVAPEPRWTAPSLLSGLVTGQYKSEQCSLRLDGLLKSSGVSYVAGRVTHMDASNHSLIVDQDEKPLRIGYDVSSIDTEPLTERERVELSVPGASQYALFTRPTNAFPLLWQRLEELATRQALHITVIGADTLSVELAFALRERFAQCTVTLVCNGQVPLASHSSDVRQRVLHRLKACAITVLPQTCTAIGADHLVLDQVTILACDAPVLTPAASARSWFANSGLALDEKGMIEVNGFQQSTSHPQVFAAGDVASQMCRAHPESSADAERAASDLATNLFAALSGVRLKTCKPPVNGLSFVSCGERYAIASRNHWSVQGRWVAYWKHWIALRLMARMKSVR